MNLIPKLVGLTLIALGVLCGCGVYSLIQCIIQGAITQNWIMVIAGGVLAYVFIGLLGLGAFFFICMDEILANRVYVSHQSPDLR